MNKPLCVVSSPCFSRSGYGDHARSIIKSLFEIDKYDVKLIPMPWGATPNIELDPSNEFYNRMLQSALRENLTTKPDIWIQITIPNEFQANGVKSIGITAGIEATLTKPEWIDGCNRMDLVITTSKFSADILKNNKFEKRNKQTNQVEGRLELVKPIEVLFEGLDLTIYDKSFPIKPVVTAELSKIKEDFAFLFAGGWLQGNLGHDRKDIGMLIKVFLDTFKRKRKTPALILKTHGAGFSISEFEIIRDKIEQIQELIRTEGWKGDFPPIYILNGELSDEEMNSLYNHPKVKAMVSFTHGEGYGRPLQEFTITGKPLFASGWSGHIDFLHPEYSFLLPGKMIKVDRSAQNDWLIDGAEWFQVDYSYASKILMDCYENYDKYLEKSRKHPKFTKDNFSEKKMSEKFLEILEKYINFQEKPSEFKLTLPKLKKA